jgi:outer membrane usher protein FimD/PapC
VFGANQSTGDSHIILIDRNGQPLAHGRIANDGSATVEGIMADDSGVWLYGHEYRNKGRSRVWIDRMDFD